MSNWYDTIVENVKDSVWEKINQDITTHDSDKSAHDDLFDFHTYLASEGWLYFYYAPLKELTLSVDEKIISVDDVSTLSCHVIDENNEDRVGETVYFYETFTPVSTLTANPNTIQSGGTSTFTIKVKDSDGNLVSLNGATVKIYEITD